MLTPAKIKNHHFEAAGRNAYKAESVDSFFEEVAESYEQMFRENGEMYKKISLLAERLEEYRNDEDNIRNALLTAQRMADKIQREAKDKADAMLAEAELKAQAENERIDAASNDMMAKATYQAKALVEEAQKRAEKMVYDATYESKAAAVSARDAMIKEEAALQMMKAEVSKFKKLILDSYNEQVALISQLPELVYEKLEPQEEAAEVEPEIEEISVEEAVVEEAPVEEIEETAAPVEEIEEPKAVAAFEAVNEEPENVDEPEAEAAEEIDVDTLQQMIEEAVDTDAEDEPYVEDAAEDEVEDVFETSGEFILPEIDETSDADLDIMLDKFADDDNESGDVFFSKAKKDDSGKEGFKVNINKISSYGIAEEIGDDDDDYLDELDEEFDNDDDDDNEGLASKFKSFFKK